jgi:NhaA family Na+:H+ antiporter
MTVPPRSRGSARVRAEHSYFVRRLLLPAQTFIHAQAVGAIVLLGAAVAAVVWANLRWTDSYEDVWTHVIVLDVGIFSIRDSARHWASDGLMVLFFFVVALEIKRELVHGELSTRRKAMLPVAAALGGMALPAVIYLAFNIGGAGERGWGIPMATDTAFALGVLALVGKRIPAEVRVFLLALAIVDDIGAILVLAVFYTESLSIAALGVALLLLGVIVVMNRIGVVSLAPYFVVGAFIWVAFLKSGIHATIAGVMLGVLAPATPYLAKSMFMERTGPLIRRLKTALAHNDQEAAETHGIILGLLLGKAAGITAASWLAVRLGVASMPRRMNWLQMASIAVIAGMGFTVSLFFTELAFAGAVPTSDAKLGIFSASIVAGGVGYLLLRWSWREAKPEKTPAIEVREPISGG